MENHRSRRRVGTDLPASSSSLTAALDNSSWRVGAQTTLKEDHQVGGGRVCRMGSPGFREATPFSSFRVSIVG